MPGLNNIRNDEFQNKGNSKLKRMKRGEHWIRQLGTAAPYGRNDHIDSVSSQCMFKICLF